MLARLCFALAVALLSLSGVPLSVRAQATRQPPSNVTVGVCVTAAGAAPFAIETSAALAYGIHLTNLDYSVIPATDILIQEVDCGDGSEAAAQQATRDLFDTYPLVIGVIAGQSDEIVRGVASVASAHQKPFISVYPSSTVQRSSVTAGGNGSYTLSLCAGEDAQAAAFMDIYAAYLNPSMQLEQPDVSRTRVRVLYSSDDLYSLALRNQIIRKAAVAGVVLNTEVDLPVAGGNDADRATDAIAAILDEAGTPLPPLGTDDALFVISSATLLPVVLQAAQNAGVLPRFVWLLSEQNLRAASSAVVAGQEPLASISVGLLGLRRSGGYIGRDSMFSSTQNYTELVGTDLSFARFVRQEYGVDLFPPPMRPSLETMVAFDAIGTLARGLTTLLALASEGSVYLRGPMILSNLLQVAYVGASGPKVFWPNGAAKNAAFDLAQVSPSTLSGARVVGTWSPLTGASVIIQPQVRLNVTLGAVAPLHARLFGAGGFTLRERVSAHETFSFVAPYNSFQAVPAMGSPPPLRYGACVVVSKYLDALLVLGGTSSGAAQPYADAWAFSFAKQTWSELPVLGVRPTPRYYGSCVISPNGQSVYSFGGLSSAGISGDLWRFSVATNQWTQVAVRSASPGQDDLASRAQRAQFSSIIRSSVGGAATLSIIGGRSRPTVNTELWTFNTSSELWTVDEVSYKPRPFLWVQPDAQYQAADYLSDLQVLPLLSSNTAAVGASLSMGPAGAERDVYILVGGYAFNTSVAFVYDVVTKQLAPLYCSGTLPGFRSLTRGVVVTTQAGGKKLVVSHGWDEFERKNYDDVWTLGLDCPGPECGKWQYALSWGDARDSLPTVLYGEGQLMTFGGWGAVLVHNDLVAYRIEDVEAPVETPEQNSLGATTIHEDYFAPPGRKFHTATVIGNRLVVYGGLGGVASAGSSSGSSGGGSSSGEATPASDTFVLTLDREAPLPDTVSGWEAQTASSSTLVPEGRYGHSSAAIRLETYIFGGRTASLKATSDLLAYSVQSMAWNRFDPVALGANGVWPAARVFHNSFASDDRYVWIQGGSDEAGNVLRDLWRFDVSRMGWELIAAEPEEPSLADTGSDVDDSSFGPPGTLPATVERKRIRPLVGCASVVVGESEWFLIGGHDAGENPSNQVVSVDISSAAGTGALTTADLVWTKHPSLPSARTGHAAALLSGRIYVSAGSSYEVALEDLWAYSLSAHTWTAVPLAASSWARPRGQVGHSMSAFGNTLTIVGGSSTEFLNLHSPLFVLQESWQFRAGPACPVGNASFTVNGVACTQCTPGTIASLRSCVPCSPGTYWSSEGVCSPCRPGFAGRLAGASSFALCIPCRNGTYSDEAGAASCKPCPADRYCPIGSATSGMSLASLLSPPDFEQSQPVSFQSRASEVADKTARLTYLLIIGLAVCGLIYLLVLLVPKLMEWIAHIDILYQFNHLQIPNKPMVRRPTPQGGLCTLVAVVMVVYLLVTLSLPYADDNTIETRSLVPNVSVKETIHVDIVASAKANGYQGACVASHVSPPGEPWRSDAPRPCAPGITVSLQDNAHWKGAANATLTCAQVADTTLRAGNVSAAGACLVTWTCSRCVGVVASEALTFSWLEVNSFASSLDWSLSTSSGYPDQWSTLSGSLSTADDRFLRGTSSASVVKVKMTPTLFVETGTQETETGYHLNFDSRTLGADVAAEAFYSSNGVLLQYQTELQLSTMSVVRTTKQTIIQFLGSLLGSISGVIGGIAVLMGITETVEEMAFDKVGGERFKGKGTAGRLQAIFRANAEEVANEAHSKMQKATEAGTFAVTKAVAVAELGAGGQLAALNGLSSPPTTGSQHVVKLHHVHPPGTVNQVADEETALLSAAAALGNGTPVGTAAAVGASGAGFIGALRGLATPSGSGSGNFPTGASTHGMGLFSPTNPSTPLVHNNNYTVPAAAPSPQIRNRTNGGVTREL